MAESIIGKNGNVADVDKDGRLQVNAKASDDFLFNLTMGNIENAGIVNKFGHGTVAGASPETIWDGAVVSGVTNYTYIATPSTLYISSDNAGDDQVYEVHGLDATYRPQVQRVTASGFTFVALDGKWIRVFRILNVGTTDNAGNIYVSDDNTDVGGNGIPDTVTNIKAMITIGNNQTLMAVYTVPVGRCVLIRQTIYTCGKGDDVEFTLWVRPFGGVLQIKDHHHVYETSFVRPFGPYLLVDEKEDIEVKGKIGAAGGESSAAFDMIIVNRI